MIGVSVPLTEAAQDTRMSIGEMSVQTDYLCAGNIIGEMGLLTGSARNASVICETTVQVIKWDLVCFLCIMVKLQTLTYYDYN